MKFGIEKCVMLIMNSGKIQITEGIELPNQERIRTLGEKEILKVGAIKIAEMKEKIRKKHLRQMRKILETKLNTRNIIKRINNRVVTLIKSSGVFLKFTREEIRQIYQKTTKKLMNKCSWCNGYRHRKWTRRHEFKSWTRLIALHIALIPLGKVWTQLFSLQVWVNSRTDWVLQPWWGN